MSRHTSHIAETDLRNSTEADARRRLEQPLDHPGLPERRGARERLRIGRAPSFDPEAVWVLASDRDGWFVRRVVHVRRVVGGEIFHDTYGAEGLLPPATAAALLAPLNAIAVGPAVEPDPGVITLDGARYSVEVRAARRRLSLSWTNAAPPAWHGLRDWYAQAVATLEQHLPACSVPLQVHEPWVE
jgi:hypothetical protein